MKEIIFNGFLIFVVISNFFGCNYFKDKTPIPNIKNLEFINEKFKTKIIIIDKNKKQYEKNIEPEGYNGWTKDFIGDFQFIYIKTENNLEGILIISNNYKKKYFSFDIITKEEFANKIKNGMIDPYRIIIEIKDNKFELKYDDTKYKIISYFNYNENYFINKEKYKIEYNILE